MTRGELIRERTGRVGTLTINRPTKSNALTVGVLFEMKEALEEWAGGGEVHAVVITGAGTRAFSGGFDVASIPTDVTEDSAGFLTGQNPVERVLNAVRDFPYPTVAMINGIAIGAGFNLAMCCDIRIAADDVRMGIPPARLGLVYHLEGVRQVVEAVGMARAREVFFTGRTYGPREVREMGLVHHMVRRTGLSRTTYALAEEIAGNAPISLTGIKRILNLVGRGPAPAEKDRKEAEDLMVRAFASEDLKEGLAAVRERRRPRFSGR